RIRISRRVAKQIDTLQPRDQARVDAAILRLEDEPRPPDVEKLSGRTNVWRVRAGDYRVVYTVDDSSQSVDILRVAHWKDVTGGNSLRRIILKRIYVRSRSIEMLFMQNRAPLYSRGPS